MTGADDMSPTGHEAFRRVSDEELLRARASRLAEGVGLDGRAPEATIRVVAARRADLLLAFPIDRVREVRRARIRTVPRAPSQIVGLFAKSGEVYCAIDVQPLLGSTMAVASGDTVLVALLTSERGTLGVRIDVVTEAMEIPTSEIERGLDPQTPFLRSVTSGMVSLVDVDALMRNPLFHIGSGQPTSGPTGPRQP